MENNSNLIAQCIEKAQQWLSPAFDEETRRQVQEMLDKEDKTDLVDAFYQTLNSVQAVCAELWAPAPIV